jgi:thioredoxin reductase
MNGFLTRDGIDPREFRTLAHRELRKYAQVKFRPLQAVKATLLRGGGFRVTFEGGTAVRARKLLLATGLFDRLPSIPGIEKFFGTSVFQCPYCHGWECRDGPIAVYGRGQRGFEMARALTAWTNDIVLLTDGPAQLSNTARLELRRNNIEVIASRIASLEGSGGKMDRIVLRNGKELCRQTLFFDTSSTEQSSLSHMLGCDFDRRGGVKCDRTAATSIPGVFAAGNITRDVQLAIVAAAEGTKAAFGINRSLTREDFSRKAETPRSRRARAGSGRSSVTGAANQIHPSPR